MSASLTSLNYDCVSANLYGLPRTIERADLHPGFAIVNADYFFRGQPSPYAQSVIDRFTSDEPDGAWEEWKARFELQVGLAVQNRLQTLFPRWSGLLPGRGARTYYRSVEDGSWLIEAIKSEESHYPLDAFDSERRATLNESTIQAALAFQEALAGRGIDILVTLVPHRQSSPAHARAIADLLGVPFVHPHIEEELCSMDGSHLDARSAGIFVEAFIRELLATPAAVQLIEKTRER